MPAWRGYISLPEGESEDPSVKRWREAKKKQAQKEGLNEPLWKIWRLLMPGFADILKDEWEMLGMLAVSVCRWPEVRLAAITARTMGATLASRNVVDFRRGLGQMVIVGLFSSWLSIASGYLQARLTWKWKKKLTHHLHDLYFKGINYYLIGEGGGKGGDKLADADSRMTEDLNKTVNAFASTYSKVIFLLTEGFFCTRPELLCYAPPSFPPAPSSPQPPALPAQQIQMPMQLRVHNTDLLALVHDITFAQTRWRSVGRSAGAMPVLRTSTYPSHT
jgi:hypothetical protein